MQMQGSGTPLGMRDMEKLNPSSRRPTLASLDAEALTHFAQKTT